MIGAFTVFDLRNLATTQPARIFLPLILVVLFGAALPVPGLAIVTGAIIASITVSYLFQGDEHGRLDTLYATSPIGRRAVAVGRYLSTLVLAAVAVGLGTVTALVMASVRQQALSGPLIVIMLLTSYAIVAIALSMQLPWLFAMGFTGGRPMIYIPIAVFSIGGMLAAQTGVLDDTRPIIAAPQLPAMVIIVVLIAGAALLTASAGVAVRLYDKRDL